MKLVKRVRHPGPDVEILYWTAEALRREALVSADLSAMRSSEIYMTVGVGHLYEDATAARIAWAYAVATFLVWGLS